MIEVGKSAFAHLHAINHELGMIAHVYLAHVCQLNLLQIRGDLLGPYSIVLEPKAWRPSTCPAFD